jgi:hypothetical protein
MPIYVYRFDDGSEVEEIFNWRDAPSTLSVDGRVAKRVPARFNANFPDPQRAEQAKQGIVPLEPGMDKDAKRARQDRLRKEDEARRKVIAETLAQF